MFFLFVKIKITIIFKKIFAILIIKIRNFVILITLNNLKFNENNLNIRSCNYNNKGKTSLKELSFNFNFNLFFISFIIFKL